MDEELKTNDNIPTSSPNEPAGTAAILKDIQQRLGFLERKIDTLLNQSSEKASFQRKPFQRQDRPFARFERHRKGPRDNQFSRSDSRPFERRSRDHRDDGPREGNFSQSEPRHFGKPHKGGRSFGAKKKPFFRRDKG